MRDPTSTYWPRTRGLALPPAKITGRLLVACDEAARLEVKSTTVWSSRVPSPSGTASSLVRRSASSAKYQRFTRIRSSSEQGCLTFHALEPPSHQDVAQVAAWTHAGVLRVLHRHGRSLEGVVDETGGDSFHDDCPVLASCYAASANDLQLLGKAPGNKTTKLVGPTLARSPSPNDAVAEVGGVNIHAKVAVDGRDRKRLERLCRYVARPPLAQDRLDVREDGRVRYRFKATWKDGTSAIVLDPLDFLARLCALVPPPRFLMLRYHGVLAPHAKVRSEVVPRATLAQEKEPEQLSLFEVRTHAALEPPPAPSPSRHPWPWLLRRVFATDILTCPRCQGRMKLVTLATDKSDIDAVLRHTHRPRAPPVPLLPPFPGQLPLPSLDSGVA